MIDNLFFIAARRADEAGVELAKALLQRAHGNRPVTLVGYSFGARVIFSCLRELARLTTNFDVAADEREELPEDSNAIVGEEDANDASSLTDSTASAANTPTNAKDNNTHKPSKRSSFSSYFFSHKDKDKKEESNTNTNDTDSKDNKGNDKEKDKEQECKGNDSSTEKWYPSDIATLIQDVVFLGAPINSRSKAWSILPRLVGGRVINGYSSKDMVLSIIYRYQRFKFSVCGVSEIHGVPGIENVNLSSIVENVSYLPLVI